MGIERKGLSNNPEIKMSPKLNTSQKVDKAVEQLRLFEATIKNALRADLPVKPGKRLSEKEMKERKDVKEAKRGSHAIVREIFEVYSHPEETEGKKRIKEISAKGGGIDVYINSLKIMREVKSTVSSEVRKSLMKVLPQINELNDDQLFEDILPILSSDWSEKEAADFETTILLPYKVCKQSEEISETMIIASVLTGYDELTKSSKK